MDTTPTVEVTTAADVTLGRTTYSVEIFTYSTGRADTFLAGPRGARYLLRPFIERDGDSGLREVISMTSGQPLRVRGNVVRVHHIGDCIEVAA